MSIQLTCPEESKCNGEFLFQYVDPQSELGETVIECEKCGRFLKSGSSIEGIPVKEKKTEV